MNYLPITLNMRGKKCLIVGGGDVAARKFKTLLRAEADVDLLSLKFSSAVQQVRTEHDLKKSSRLIKGEVIRKSSFETQIIGRYALIIAATDSPIINRMVSVVAQRCDILVNVVDNLELSSFILPAIIDRSPLLVAVSTAGVSPLLARKIREKIEWVLPKNLGSIFASLKSLRKKLKREHIGFREKKDIFEEYIDAKLSGEKPTRFEYLDKNNASISKLVDNRLKNVKGTVYLVGAGPSDPDLLTIKALKLLQKADIVFYDALISDDILELIRHDAKIVPVGKRANLQSVHQGKINHLLIESVKENTTVVRLKGGDPFIFGRGGEELEALQKNGINYQVIPGITAASGCASYAGIPLTHRHYAQAIHFVTAHEKDGKSSLDWNGLAKKNQTLVFYMGLQKNRLISKKLIENGLNPQTSVAIIENGTRLQQRVVTGKISELTNLAKENQINAPALIIVGEVVGLQKKLQWFNLQTQNIKLELGQLG